MPGDCRCHQRRCASCAGSACPETTPFLDCMWRGAARRNMPGLSGSRASPDMVALLTSREETAELLKMKQSVATRSLSALSRLFNFSSAILSCCFPDYPVLLLRWFLACFMQTDFLGSRYVDLIIPRGSNDFVQYVMRNTDIPVRDAQHVMRRHAGAAPCRAPSFEFGYGG